MTTCAEMPQVSMDKSHIINEVRVLAFKTSRLFQKSAKPKWKEEGVDLPSGFEELRKYVGRPNTFFTMTALEKVGVNPRSVNNLTPNGIYCYPLDEEHFEKLSKGEWEWALDSPFINVVEYTGNKLFDVADTVDVKSLLPAIKKWCKISGIDFDKNISIKRNTYTVEVKSKYADEKTEQKPVENTGKCLYRLTEVASGYNFTKWADLLRYLGFDGVSDLITGAVMYARNKFQVCFFSIKNLKVLDRIKNKNGLTDAGKTSTLKAAKRLRQLIEAKNMTEARSFYDELTQNPKYSPSALGNDVNIEDPNLTLGTDFANAFRGTELLKHLQMRANSFITPRLRSLESQIGYAKNPDNVSFTLRQIEQVLPSIERYRALIAGTEAGKMLTAIDDFVKKSSQAPQVPKHAMPMPAKLPKGWSIKQKETDDPTNTWIGIDFDIVNDQGKNVATMAIGKTRGTDVWNVAWVKTKVNGYGAFLYENAMKWVSARGEHLAPDSDVSDDAAKVWNKYHDRPDIEKIPHERSIFKYRPQSEDDDPDVEYEKKPIRRNEPSLQFKYRKKLLDSSPQPPQAPQVPKHE